MKNSSDDGAWRRSAAGRVRVRHLDVFLSIASPSSGADSVAHGTAAECAHREAASAVAELLAELLKAQQPEV